MSIAGLAAIPWRFQDSGTTKMWQWQTDHFDVTITGEATSFYWEIGDLIVPNDGAPRFLAEGRSGDFATAERDIRETIGKSYPSTLGYRHYSGALATTFTLATGQRADLGEYNGQSVVVIVRLPNGGTQHIVGHAAVVHYELHVTPTHGAAVRVQPSHIVQVRGEGGGGASAGAVAYTGIGRMYRGSVSRGCTGKPGFMPGTIDHTGASCPAHEQSGTRFASMPTPR